MVAMKRVFLLVTGLGIMLSTSAMLLVGADLSEVRSVYLLPMGSGLDQFLANRLTNEHLFQVVTDPKRADAVFTDRIGAGFEERLADLLAPPPSEKPAPASTPANQSSANQPATNQNLPPALAALGGETANKLSNPAVNSSFGHGKGTIFLVDVKSKQVIWSVYELPKNQTSGQMDRSAFDIVSRLKRDLKKPEGAKP